MVLVINYQNSKVYFETEVKLTIVLQRHRTRIRWNNAK